MRVWTPPAPINRMGEGRVAEGTFPLCTFKAHAWRAGAILRPHFQDN